MANVILQSSGTQDTLYPVVTSDSTYITSSVTLTAALNAAITSAINKIYPVNSLYFSMSSTSPASIFPSTTWERYGVGKLLRNSGSITDQNGNSVSYSLGGTGGEYEHTITIDEMTAHAHFLGSRSAKGGSSVTDYGRSVGTKIWTSYVGGGVARENTQPSLTCYIWRRLT